MRRKCECDKPFFEGTPNASFSRLGASSGVPAQSTRRDGFPRDDELTGRMDTATLLCPLAALRDGDRAIVCDLKCTEALNCRLIGLGILPGTSVRVLRAGSSDSPMLFQVGNTRVGLSRTICMTILARPLSEDDFVEVESNERALYASDALLLDNEPAR